MLKTNVQYKECLIYVIGVPELVLGFERSKVLAKIPTIRGTFSRLEMHRVTQDQ